MSGRTSPRPLERCDICGYGAKRDGLTMIQCESCKLFVHKECNGMEVYKKKTFRCWACQAVGRSFHVEAKDQGGRRLEIVQTHRPTQCALCSIDTGIHAMHPLYDNYGPNARQLHRGDQLVWAHSLCCFFLTAKRGFLYGCSRDGNYNAAEDDDWSDDERPPNPELMIAETSVNENDGDHIHHFVWPVASRDQDGKFVGQHAVWAKAAEEHQRDLKCQVCGKDDKPSNILRIPLQCCANDDDEYSDFKGKHPSLRDDESCFLAQHVGCARWGTDNKKNIKRIYYFPGDSGDQEPVALMYCITHGEEVDVSYQKKLKKAQGTMKAMASTAKQGSGGQSPASKKAVRQMNTVISPTIQRKRVSQPTATLPSLARVAPGQRSRAKKLKKPTATTSTAKPRAGRSRPSKPQDHEFMDKDAAAPMLAGVRPKLITKRKQMAKELASRFTVAQLDEVKDDLEKTVLPVSDVEHRKIVFKERKKHWKRELSALETTDFKKLWIQAREYVSELILARDAGQNVGKISRNRSIQDPLRNALSTKPGGFVKKRKMDGDVVDLTGSNSEDDSRKTGALVTKSSTSGRALKKSTGEREEPDGPNKAMGKPDEDTPVVNDIRPELPPRTRWSFLAVGPYYCPGKDFKFKEWEKFETLS